MMLEHSHPDSNLETKLKIVESQGKGYAKALLQLIPELANIAVTDKAAAFDVGRGTDLIAFSELGFQNVVWTNEPDARLALAMPAAFETEEAVLTEVLKKLPNQYYASSLSCTDWLSNSNFVPTLTTMLRMAPQYFGNTLDPAQFLKNFASFAERLPKKSSIVLSAVGDHENSERAFILADDFFKSLGLASQLFLDSQDALKTFGEQLLVLRGKN